MRRGFTAGAIRLTGAERQLVDRQRVGEDYT